MRLGAVHWTQGRKTGEKTARRSENRLMTKNLGRLTFDGCVVHELHDT